MIDIVVPWVNPSDKNWQELNKKYSNSKGDNSKQRTRDIHIFKYFFRGIEENCPWVRKIHLLLQSPTQIPDWLNTNNSKLHIVYHDQYIPNEFLPTFNTFVIEAFFHKIPDLTENFITCNDDFLFTNLTKETDFFINDLPVDNPKQTKFLTCNPIHDKIYKGGKFNMFQNVLKSSQKIEKQITSKCPIYFNFHTPFGLKKSFIEYLWEKHSNLFLAALKDSRFRRDHNFVSWLYRYIRLDLNQYIKSENIITDFSYRELGVSDIKNIMSDILTKKIIVLNDMLTNKNENIIANQITRILEAKFPNKSSFEK